MGPVQTILVCQSSPGAPQAAPCGPDQVVATVQGYVLQEPDLSVFEPVDAATASSVFLAAFSAVVTCFFVARVVGSVLDMIRK